MHYVSRSASVVGVLRGEFVVAGALGVHDALEAGIAAPTASLEHTADSACC
ncbi:hypothetical protein [Nocardia salmonicida]|uniref:hypothetical protein n=1 Tax=Nocardia salmonicida TaxID=53431 RepID=UPI0012F48118|nr:hypothetical protein [Nocardia salmonicida]